jgi:hypothetical protein
MARRSALTQSGTQRIGQGIQATLAQPGAQIAHHRGVLGRAFGQPQRDLCPADRDAERDDAGVLSGPDPVDHERHQIQAGQVGGEQVDQAQGGHLRTLTQWEADTPLCGEPFGVTSRIQAAAIARR